MTEPVLPPTASSPSIGPRARLAVAVAAEVDRVPGVHRFGGCGVENATQHAGGCVDGVTVAATDIGVHVVASRFPLGPLSDAVRAAAQCALDALGDHRPVIVHIDDVEFNTQPEATG